MPITSRINFEIHNNFNPSNVKTMCKLFNLMSNLCENKSYVDGKSFFFNQHAYIKKYLLYVCNYDVYSLIHFIDQLS